LGNTSWLIDLGDRRVAVVDPGRYPGDFSRRPNAVAPGGVQRETHLHADFVTGSRELASYGTTVAPAAGGLEWPHRPMSDGEVVDLGGLSLRALSTPGHTPSTSPISSAMATARSGPSPGSLLVGAVAVPI
jgi:glyoxylase-like metal-dependent hydrolase (beta-lactamase superfamily II)